MKNWENAVPLYMERVKIAKFRVRNSRVKQTASDEFVICQTSVPLKFSERIKKTTRFRIYEAIGVKGNNQSS